MATERSDFSQAHVPDPRTKASVTEITAEIIGQPKPTLATIGKRASRGNYNYYTFIRTKAGVTETTVKIIGQPKPTLATIGKRASRGNYNSCILILLRPMEFSIKF